LQGKLYQEFRSFLEQILSERDADIEKLQKDIEELKKENEQLKIAMLQEI